MNQHPDFDELARRKLAERKFDFKEDDWLAAQHLIKAERATGSGWSSVVLTGALLVGAGALWLWSASNNDPGPNAVVAQDEVVHVTATPRPQEGTTATKGVPSLENDLNAPEAPNRTIQPLASAVEPTGASTGLKTMPAARTAEKKIVASAHNADTGHHPDPIRDAVALNGTASAAGTVLANELKDVAARAPDTSTSDHEPVTILAGGADDDQVNGGDALPFHTKPAADNDHSVQPEPHTSAPLAGEDHAAGSADVSTPTAQTSADPMQPAGVIASHADDGTGPIVAHADSALPPESTAATIDAGVDTTGQERIMLSPKDSAALEPAPPMVPVATPGSPWQISVLGGFHLSQSQYSGGSSDLWRDASHGRWAPQFGAELMHIGRNFGVGSGLHFVSYAEDLDVKSQSVTTASSHDTSYFESFDTTLLVVTGDTIINGQTYFTTVPFQTTVFTLLNGTVTTMSTRQSVQALKAANRVSYLEIPLLFDAHVQHGRWAFGLRGGPTVGLLTSRSGSLPRAMNDDDLVDEERTFKTTMFGATGRAYARYRLASGWAIGLEPTWRMQFGNALVNGDIKRRNSGVGGQISLTYQLR